MHLAMRPTPCTTGQVHLLVLLIKTLDICMACMHLLHLRDTHATLSRRSTHAITDVTLELYYK